ncbi:Heterodimeric geranylgeranyl pyrophosphate synthase small subunit [Spatholobus suberectus]|nr:Heterodimeric geranylgeranyl pyrophosphate synthase small subunit [Spatholobus suberectus]
MQLDLVQKKKFGEIRECFVVCVGLLVGVEDDEIEKLRKFGRAIRVLYVVVDDILEERLKAKGGSDKKIREKLCKGLWSGKRNKKKAKELIAKAKEELDGFEKYGEPIFPIYIFVDYSIEKGGN